MIPLQVVRCVYFLWKGLWNLGSQLCAFTPLLFFFFFFFFLILTKRWRHFGRRFCVWNKYLMLSYWYPDYHLSVFQKLRYFQDVTRLKVAPNMADPISIKDSDSSLKNLILFLIYRVKIYLRLRSVFVKTYWAYHVWCNFWLGYTCWTTVICGTLKDDSLHMIFQHQTIFSVTETSSETVSTLCHFMENHFFVKKLKILHSSDHIVNNQFVQIHQHMIQILIK